MPKRCPATALHSPRSAKRHVTVSRLMQPLIQPALQVGNFPRELRPIGRHAFQFLTALERIFGDDPAVALESQLEVGFPNRSEIMRVRLPGFQADKLVAIVDAVILAYLKEYNTTVDAERAFRQQELQQQCDAQRQSAQKLSDESQQLLDQIGAAGRPAIPIAEELERRSVSFLQERVNQLLDEKIKAEIEADTLACLKKGTAEGDVQLDYHRASVAVLEEKAQEQTALLKAAVKRLQQILIAAEQLETQTARQAETQGVVYEMEREIQRLKLQSQIPPRVMLLQKAEYVR